MEKYNCIIVDDEPLAVEAVELLLENYPDFNIVAKCSDALSAFSALNEFRVDLMFLDIQMPKITGVEFLKNLKHPPKVIFTTAYSEYALEGFELDVIDYLLKPISDERFMKAIDKFYRITKNSGLELLNKKAEENKAGAIFLRVDRKTHRVNPENIYYVESMKDYVKVITENEVLITKSNIGKFLEILPEGKFIRIHKSYIINLNKFTSYDNSCVTIMGKELPFGYTYKENFLIKVSRNN